MRSQLCLWLLAAVGFGYIVLSEDWIGIDRGNSDVVVHYWLSSLRWFAIPLSLSLLQLTRSRLVLMFKFLWGLWLAVLSLIVLFGISSTSPTSSFYGIVLLGAVLILSVGLVLFSTIELRARPKNNSPF